MPGTTTAAPARRPAPRRAAAPLLAGALGCLTCALVGTVGTAGAAGADTVPTTAPVPATAAATPVATPAAAATTPATAAATPATAAASTTTSVPAGAPTLADAGYWMTTNAGTVGNFGGTPALGYVTGALNRPVVGMAATPDGAGYWLVASDGGVFSYGHARFFGSTGAMRLNQPIVGMASTPDGGGYWLVASDGGIFSFGDARFYGSTGALRLAQPVTAMTATASGRGYWLVARDGGVFSFGDARFYGSTGANPPAQPVVSALTAPGGSGYWLVDAAGGVHPFGSATSRGAGTSTLPGGAGVVGAALGTGTGAVGGTFPTVPVVSTAAYPSGSTGYDISWPQCGAAYPPASRVAVVGVNDGYTFSTNGCLASEASWGGSNLSLYINMDSPSGSNSAEWATGPAGTCAIGDTICESYNWGWHAAQQSVATAAAHGVSVATWWLDVETGNTWSSDTAANAQVLAGALAELRALGKSVSIYSTSYQYGVIAGTYRPGVPVWYPTGTATTTPQSWCASSSFTGGRVSLVQDAVGAFDGDYSC